MTDERNAGGGRSRDAPPAVPPPSPRVQLEAELLASDPGAPRSPPVQEGAATDGRTVLVLAEDPDTRYYVVQCLRACPGVRVIETDPAHGPRLELGLRPDLLIVKGSEADIPAWLSAIPAILLDDNWSSDSGRNAASSGPARSRLALPFNPGSLVSLVVRLLERA